VTLPRKGRSTELRSKEGGKGYADQKKKRGKEVSFLTENAIISPKKEYDMSYLGWINRRARYHEEAATPCCERILEWRDDLQLLRARGVD